MIGYNNMNMHKLKLVLRIDSIVAKLGYEVKLKCYHFRGFIDPVIGDL